MLTKSESLQLKGSAILIMVLLHLFNRQENIDKCIISINLRMLFLYDEKKPLCGKLFYVNGEAFYKYLVSPYVFLLLLFS